MSGETWKWLCTLSAHQTWLSFLHFSAKKDGRSLLIRFEDGSAAKTSFKNKVQMQRSEYLQMSHFIIFLTFTQYPKTCFCLNTVEYCVQTDKKINSIHFRLVWKCGKRATAWKLCLILTVQRIYKVIIQTKLKPSNKCKSFFSRNEHWNHKNTIKPMINS